MDLINAIAAGGVLQFLRAKGIGVALFNLGTHRIKSRYGIVRVELIHGINSLGVLFLHSRLVRLSLQLANLR